MRCDQFMGLNEAGQQIVKGCSQLHFSGKYELKLVYNARHGSPGMFVNVPVLEPCVRCEPTGKIYAGYDGPYPLVRYIFREGGVLEECVQASPWSSGPVFFLALVDEKGNWVPESLWTEEEISKA